MSNLFEKMKKAVNAVEKKAVDAIPESAKAPEEITKARWDICSNCEFLYKPTNTCKKCGCFMVLKTSLKKVKCPINKWGRYEP